MRRNTLLEQWVSLGISPSAAHAHLGCLVRSHLAKSMSCPAANPVASTGLEPEPHIGYGDATGMQLWLLLWHCKGCSAQRGGIGVQVLQGQSALRVGCGWATSISEVCV